MSYDRLRFECRHDGCSEAFLTVHARSGHSHIHRQDEPEIRTDGGTEASYHVVAHPTAERDLDTLTDDIQGRIRDVLDDMASHRQPSAPHAVSILDDSDGMMRVRVGRYRAIVARDGARLILLAVGHRDNFYQHMLPIAERRLDR